MLQFKSTLRETPIWGNGSSRERSLRNLGRSVVDWLVKESLQTHQEERKSMPGSKSLRSKCMEEGKGRQRIRKTNKQNNKSLLTHFHSNLKEERMPVFKVTDHSLLWSECLCSPLPSNSHIEILAPNVMVWGGRALGGD